MRFAGRELWRLRIVRLARGGDAKKRLPPERGPVVVGCIVAIIRAQR
jgi:hypothetical protein